MIYFYRVRTLLHISCTSDLDDSPDFLSSFVDPPKPLMIEGSDDNVVGVDEGLNYDVSNHNDVYITHIHA